MPKTNRPSLGGLNRTDGLVPLHSSRPNALLPMRLSPAQAEQPADRLTTGRTVCDLLASLSVPRRSAHRARRVGRYRPSR